MCEMKEIYPYHIYTDGTAQVNAWLYTHLKEFGNLYTTPEGEPDVKKLAGRDDGCYCEFDTYMQLSDYNRLREMLGYERISLGENEYAIHIKKRVLGETGDFSEHLRVKGESGELIFSGYYSETFSQDGHNGGDYVIVVPDGACALTPYYSELAVDIEGEAPAGLGERLDDLDKKDVYSYLDWSDSEEDEEDVASGPNNSCCGSDTIITYAAVNLVRDNLIPEVKYMLSSIVFPCFYIGLVFVCVALTVLSVQQLSDSAKYKFRYGVLGKMGLSRREVAGVIRRQLVAYYLCPAAFAAAVAGIIALFISRKFIFYTGVETEVFQYFGMSFLLFCGVYALYFVTTYVEFRQNVESGR